MKKSLLLLHLYPFCVEEEDEFWTALTVNHCQSGWWGHSNQRLIMLIPWSIHAVIEHLCLASSWIDWELSSWGWTSQVPHNKRMMTKCSSHIWWDKWFQGPPFQWIVAVRGQDSASPGWLRWTRQKWVKGKLLSRVEIKKALIPF